MKKLNILLVIIIINFLSINFAFAKSECDEILSNKMAMSMTTGVGKMFFNGYNHAKGSNFNYSESKMKKFIRASCTVDNNIKIDKIFANAADTNFDMSKFKKTTVSEKLRKIDKFFIYLDGDFKNVFFRKCYINNLKDSAITLFEGSYDKLEPMRNAAQIKRYTKDMMLYVFGAERLGKIMKTFEKIEKKCVG